VQRIDLFLYNFFCTRLITFLFFSFFLVTDVPPSTQPAENIFSVAFLFFSFFTSCNCFLFVSRRLFLAFGFFLFLIRLILHIQCRNFYTFFARLWSAHFLFPFLLCFCFFRQFQNCFKRFSVPFACLHY